MKADAPTHPRTPGEALRFESVEHARYIHERARRVRTLVIVLAAAAALARCVFALTDWTLAIPDGPAMLGMLFLVSFVTVSLEWSTRRQYRDRVEAYDAYLAESRVAYEYMPTRG